jgi:hypothetical protein
MAKQQPRRFKAFATLVQSACRTIEAIDANSTLRHLTAVVAVLAADARASKPAPRRQVFEPQDENESPGKDPGNSAEGCPRPLRAPATNR